MLWFYIPNLLRMTSVEFKSYDKEKSSKNDKEIKQWISSVEKWLKISEEKRKNTEKQQKSDAEEADKLLDDMMDDMDREKYLDLCMKESLTDDEVQWLVKYEIECAKRNDCSAFIQCHITSITDKQAEYLSNVDGLELQELTKITDKQAEYLSNVSHLSLEITSITDKQAECLSNVDNLFLSCLTKITDKQAECLSNVSTLYLGWLKSITDKQLATIIGHGTCLLTLDERILSSDQRKLYEQWKRLAFYDRWWTFE